MIIIANMQMPESCQTCPFSHKVFGFASCIAKAQYESPDNGGTFSAAILHDGNSEQRDSSCPLYDDTTIDAALEEIKRLRGEVARLTGACLTPPHKSRRRGAVKPLDNLHGVAHSFRDVDSELPEKPGGVLLQLPDISAGILPDSL